MPKNLRPIVITFKELLERYAAGERKFSGITLVLDTPFRELDEWELQGVNLSKAILKGADLDKITLWMHGINLSGADLRNVDLNYARFIEADLSGANLSRACLWRASLDRANLAGANLSGADLQETMFHETNLSGVNLSKAEPIDTYFGGANLTDVDFRNVKLQKKTDFTGANLTRTNFFGVNLDNAVFRNAYFCETIMPDGSVRSSEI